MVAMLFSCPKCSNEIKIDEKYPDEFRMGIFCQSCGQLLKIHFQIEVLDLYGNGQEKTGDITPADTAMPKMANTVLPKLPAGKSTAGNQVLAEQIEEKIPVGDLDLKEEVVKWAAEKNVQLPILPEIRKKISGFSTINSLHENQLIKLIQTDQVLAATTIRYANTFSPQNSGKVDKLSDAATILGLNRIHKAIMHVAESPVNNSSKLVNNGILKKLWIHNLASAMGSKWLSKKLNIEDPEKVFLLGLIHDIGKTIILQIFSELKENNQHLTLQKKQVNKIIKELHPKIGADTLQAWNFPSDMVETVRFHEKSNTKDPLIEILIVTNMLCKKLGLGPSQDPNIGIQEVQSNVSLPLDDVIMAHMEVELENLMMRITRFL
jgi:HD-like signal output (HDOD) protein